MPDSPPPSSSSPPPSPPPPRSHAPDWKLIAAFSGVLIALLTGFLWLGRLAERVDQLRTESAREHFSRLMVELEAKRAELDHPVGSVVAFWGSVADARAAENYELCDGTQVTTAGSPILGIFKPNLADRFIMGVTAVESVVTAKIVGGQNEIPARPQGNQGRTFGHALNIAEMPSHNHGGQTGQAGRADLGDGYLLICNGHNTPSGMDGSADEMNLKVRDAIKIRNVPDHRHSIASQGDGTEHSHALPEIPGHDNRPAFVGMFYLIRVK